MGGSKHTQSMFRVAFRLLRSRSRGDDEVRSIGASFRGRAFATGLVDWNGRRVGFARRQAAPAELVEVGFARRSYGRHKADPTNAALSSRSERKHQLGMHEDSELAHSAPSSQTPRLWYVRRDRGSCLAGLTKDGSSVLMPTLLLAPIDMPSIKYCFLNYSGGRNRCDIFDRRIVIVKEMVQFQ
jgi:hypothetical protein